MELQKDTEKSLFYEQVYSIFLWTISTAFLLIQTGAQTEVLLNQGHLYSTLRNQNRKIFCQFQIRIG